MDEQRLEIFMAASLIGILANPQRHAPPADIAKSALIQAQAAVEVLNAARPKKEPRDFGLDIPSPVVLAERRRDLASQIVAGLPMYGPPYLEGGAEADSHRRAAEAFIEQKLGEVPVRG